MKHLISYKARMRWAVSLFPAVVVLSAGAAPDAPDSTALRRGAEYSVINLAPDATVALLNQRGQAAIGSYATDGFRNEFFDGSRVRTIASLGGRWTWIRGLNNHGVIVGESEDAGTPSPITRAFAWSAARGMRALPGPAPAVAYAINDQNQVVGQLQAPGIPEHAIRWNPDGSLTRLGPVSSVSSIAYAINDSAMAVGNSDSHNITMRATVWNAAGAATDLGPLGRDPTTGQYINAKGDVAGQVAGDLRQTSFFWSRSTGILPLGINASEHRMQFVTALNDNGEVAGNVQIANSTLLDFIPFIWSARGGLHSLPIAGAVQGHVYGLNKRREMVGFVQATRDWRSRRAVHWSGRSAPVDLNTRLHRAPASLVLYSARALNDKGTILADSNAGLVLLRPGKTGTAAPVLGPIAPIGTISGRGELIALNATIDFTVGFVDSADETHVAVTSVDDNCPQGVPSLRQARGVGEVSVRHTFCRRGDFTIKVKVTDCAGNTTQVQRVVFVTEPSVPTLIGQGVLQQAGATSSRGGNAALPLRFALWAPLTGSRAGAPGTVELSGPFHFRAELLDQAERIGQSVRLGGQGRYNGRAGYRFHVEAHAAQLQGEDADRLHVRISHIDAATKAEVIDYDNGTDAAPAGAAMLRAGVAPIGAPGTLLDQGQLRIAQ